MFCTGCVRLWNPLLSGKDKENGKCLARMNSDIAHFSIGDRFKGEHQLVACVFILFYTALGGKSSDWYMFSGDSSGEVMIFNNIIV